MANVIIHILDVLAAMHCRFGPLLLVKPIDFAIQCISHRSYVRNKRTNERMDERSIELKQIIHTLCKNNVIANQLEKVDFTSESIGN